MCVLSFEPTQLLRYSLSSGLFIIDDFNDFEVRNDGDVSCHIPTVPSADKPRVLRKFVTPQVESSIVFVNMSISSKLEDSPSKPFQFLLLHLFSNCTFFYCALPLSPGTSVGHTYNSCMSVHLSEDSLDGLGIGPPVNQMILSRIGGMACRSGIAFLVPYALMIKQKNPWFAMAGALTDVWPQ